MSKALLLLDVDGVLNPIASRKYYDENNFRRRNTTVSNGLTFPVWLKRDHGKRLLDLCADNDAELVWCTTWEHEANEFIGPRLGLPELPVITFGFEAINWKFNAVLKYAAGRPLAWFDDDFQLHHKDRDWFVSQRTEPTLLHEVVPAIGLVDEDFDTVNKWFKDL